MALTPARRQIAGCAVVVALLLAFPSWSRTGDPPADRHDSTDTHELYYGGGFDIVIPKEFIDERPDDARAALETLSDRLEAASAVIPADRLRKLTDVRFLIEWKPAHAKLAPTLAHYLLLDWGADWDNRYAGKGGSVEVLAERALIGTSGARITKTLPYWALHELAHAYHDRVVVDIKEKVRKAYRNAMDRGLYANVITRYPQDGLYNPFPLSSKGRAYAATNEWEYFAELSVAYLAWNPTFPHTQKDLNGYDPDGYQLMVDAWGIPDAARSASSSPDGGEPAERPGTKAGAGTSGPRDEPRERYKVAEQVAETLQKSKPVDVSTFRRAAAGLERNKAAAIRDADPVCHEFSRYLLGELLYLHRDHESAITSLRDALRAFPDSDWATRGRFRLAQCYWQLAIADSWHSRGAGLDSLVPEPGGPGQSGTGRGDAGNQFRRYLRDARVEFDRVAEAFAARERRKDLTADDPSLMRQSLFRGAECTFFLKEYLAAASRYAALRDRYTGRFEELVALSQLWQCYKHHLNEPEQASAVLARMADRLKALPDSEFDGRTEIQTRYFWEKWLDQIK